MIFFYTQSKIDEKNVVDYDNLRALPINGTNVEIGGSLQEFHRSQNDGTESVYAKIEKDEEVDVNGDNVSENCFNRWFNNGNDM